MDKVISELYNYGPLSEEKSTFYIFLNSALMLKRSLISIAEFEYIMEVIEEEITLRINYYMDNLEYEERKNELSLLILDMLSIFSKMKFELYERDFKDRLVTYIKKLEILNKKFKKLLYY